MRNVTVVIPNLNGAEYLRTCLESLRLQSVGQVSIIVVDNGSQDESRELLRRDFPEVRVIALDQNYGFCRAVNVGIRAAKTKYVLLLNNDIRADQDLIRCLLRRMERSEKIFSCQARMLQMDHPDKIDNAGDFYSAFGWAMARGRDMPADAYPQACRIFSACGGAAIYRRSVFARIGLFDEAHFAYLEDVDIGYRARLCGYENWYEPGAVVYHKGSAVSGSRYNAFKVRHAARNSIYVIYKNMPCWQILLNLQFLAAGCLIKSLFFWPKGLAPVYLSGVREGLLMSGKGQKCPLLRRNFLQCCRIQLWLWAGLGRILRKNK